MPHVSFLGSLRRSRARRIALLSATILAGGLAGPAEAALYAVVVNQVQDPLFTNLTIPDAAPVVGMWSNVYDWPMNAIHLGLMPNGRVVSYGAPGGNPGVQDGRTFDIWDPAQGMVAGGHKTLQGVSGINSFCAAQAYQADGSLLIAGGIFDNNKDKGSLAIGSATNGVTALSATLANDRYYSTMITLPDGRQLIVGGSYPYLGGWADPQGSIDKGYMTGMTPEILANGAWTSLFGAKSRSAFGPDYSRWWYPRAWVAPSGKVFGISTEQMWTLDTSGTGSVVSKTFREAPREAKSWADAPNTGPTSTAVMYDTGKILQVGGNSFTNGDGYWSSNRATVFDINGADPVPTDTANMVWGRSWANATVLPTGTVTVTGGSSWNDRAGDSAIYAAEAWDPKTGKWTTGPNAAIYRGYHSSSILMQNGAILVAGGGAPGPVNNQNAEIFYPPYLFTTVNGKAALAPRPSIVSLTTNRLAHGQSMQFELSSQNGLSQVVLIGLSVTTHSFNSGQRRYPAAFSVAGNAVTVQTPPSGAVAPPGYYQLVAVDQKGVPSPGVIVALGANVAAPQQTAVLVASVATGSSGGTGTGGTGGGTGGTGGGTAGGTGTGGTGTGSLGGTIGPVGLALKAAHSGLCLSAPAGNNADGAAVTQQPCTGAAEQSWQTRPGNNGQIYVNAANGKCLDMTLAGPVQPGSKIHQWTCNGGTNQSWTSRAQGQGNALVSVYNANLCIDIIGGSTAAGAGTIAWTCHGGANQTFSGGTSRIALKAAHSGLCLSVPAGNGQDGAAVTQQACSGAAEQSWLVRLGNGGQTFVNAASGKCLDMSLAGPVAAGTQVSQWTCNGQTNQSWQSKAQGAGSSLTSANTANLCLDVTGGSTAAGGGTIVWTCQGSANQTFTAVSVQSATQ